MKRRTASTISLCTGAKADLARRLAVEVAADRPGGERQVRVVAARRAQRGDVTAVVRDVEDRAERDLLAAEVAAGAHVAHVVGADMRGLAGRQANVVHALERGGAGDADQRRSHADMREIAAVAAA